jgi:hypothetical protein
MRISAALFPIALVLGAITLAPPADAREPTMIKACGTISQPGSYELADNLTTTGNCLVITADFVTIDLAGFSIDGGGSYQKLTLILSGILAQPANGQLEGIAVRNGSITGFLNAVDLHSANGSNRGVARFPKRICWDNR